MTEKPQRFTSVSTCRPSSATRDARVATRNARSNAACGALRELLRAALTGRNHRGDRGVGDVAVELRGDVDLHDVAAGEQTRSGTPCTTSSFTLMQLKPGKSYVSCGAERAPRLRRNLAPIVVELLGRHPRCERRPHLAQRLGDELADRAHGGEVVLGFDSHGVALTVANGESMLDAPPIRPNSPTLVAIR